MRKLFVLCTFCFLLLPSPLFASIEIDPMRMELQADSGKPIAGYISITNRGNENIDISLSPGEYRYMFSVETIYPKNSEPQTLPSCKNWINLKPDKVKLEKGKTQQIQYSINVPSSAKNEYVAAILIDEEQPAAPIEPGTAGQVRIKITPRINIPVYVEIKDSLKMSCEITNLEAVSSKNKKFVWFSAAVKNSGTVHIRPTVTLTIIDQYKTVVKKIPLGKTLPIFAGFAERLTAEWVPDFTGKYTVVATADIGTENFAQKSAEFDVK